MSSPIRTFFSFLKRLFTGSLGSRKSRIRLLAVGVARGRYGACPGASLDAQRIHDKVSAGKKAILLDSAATRKAVTNALKSGIAGTEDDGLFVFFYSGHGGQAKSSDPSEDDGRDETLCLYDAELVDNTIWSILQSAKCRVFMVTDCCHSGSNYRSASPLRGFVAARSAESPKGLRLLHWGGCQDSTYSYGDEAGGVMTNAILSQIGKGVSYKDAFKHVVAASRAYQAPVKASIGFDEKVEVFK